MELVRRALRAGYQGIFVTVDSVRFGYREADARNNFNALPPPHRLVNYDDPMSLSSSNEERRLDEIYNSGKEKAWDQNSEQMFEQDVTWDDITTIKREIGNRNIPLVVKGIMTAEDAELAIRAGADAIVVSNHGGRQLDGALASIDALEGVVQAVAGRIPVWLDSGVRRGTDILKALALGASAVGIGKPFFYALALGGEDGVSYLLELLRTELEAAMAICGIRRISDITRDLVVVANNYSHPATIMPVDIPSLDRLSKL
jgi:isopentenyl diphosphate isomerase/L-lactate dehydrogenase-like FMN-dependent dehydrogenase